MKKYLLLFFLFPLLVSAQFIERQVVSNAGAEMENGDLSITWTMGEILTRHLEGNLQGLEISQGFHQGTVLLVSTINYDVDMNFEVFPNPTTATVFITSDTEKNLTVSVVDLLGRVVGNHQLNYPIEKSAIDLTQLPAATYFLKVTDENNNLVYIFNLQKIN